MKFILSDNPLKKEQKESDEMKNIREGINSGLNDSEENVIV